MEMSTILTGAGSILAATGGYLAAKLKAKDDSFKSIIAANESFREEVKGDLNQAKKDLQEAGKTMDHLQKEIAVLHSSLDEAKDEIKRLKIEREEMIKRLVNYEIEVTRLREAAGLQESELIAMRKANIALVERIEVLSKELQQYQTTK